MPVDQRLQIASIIFGIISLLHLVRAIAGWQVTFNATVIPVWASYIAFLVAGMLAVWLWRK